MVPAVIKVQPLPNYHLLLTFANGEQRVFDTRPFLHVGRYRDLKNVDMFNTVRPCFDAIQWDNALDFDPEFLYEKSVLTLD